MTTASRSEKGRLPRNEDAVKILQDPGVFLLCDGLSVKEGGDVASRIACDTLGEWIRSHSSLVKQASERESKDLRKKVEEMVVEGVQLASKAIFAAAATNPAHLKMCTTLDLLLLLGSHALIAHVGANRVYLVRHGENHQLTDDHTQLAHQRRIGKKESLSQQEQASMAKRLTRAVGYQEEVKVDLLEVELEVGDRFLMVTDGVWLSLGDEAMERYPAGQGSAQELVDRIHKEVSALDPRDNYSTIVADVSPPPSLLAENSAEQKIRMLGKVPIFEFLSYHELIKVLNVADLFKVKFGHVLCKEGDAGGEMMLILSGGADVLKNGQKINSLQVGDAFGEMSMVDSAPRSATVKTNASTNLLAFPRESLFALLREEPELAVKFLWGVTMEVNKRLRKVSNQLVGLPENSAMPESGKKDGLYPFLRSL